MKLKSSQRFLVLTFSLLAIGLACGGLYVRYHLQTVKQALPISTLSQHRELSVLIQHLGELSAKLDGVIIETSPDRLDELSIYLDIAFALSKSFFENLARPQARITLFLSEEVSTILGNIERLGSQIETYDQSQALALLTRLDDTIATLQDIYLHANQQAFASLSKQILRIEQLSLGSTIVAEILAALFAIIALLLWLRFRTNQVLSQAREKLDILFSAIEQSPISVIITDPDGTVEYVNPCFTQVSGYSQDEIFKQDLETTTSQQTTNAFLGVAKEKILAGENWRGDLCSQKKNGEELWESVSVSPILSTDKTIHHYVVVKEDITLKKTTETALQKAMEKAEQETKAKSEFLANMSHEIRTPMNSVIGFSELLENMITDPLQKDYLRSVIIGGRALLEIINDILDLSKIEAGKLSLTYEIVNIKTLLREIEALFATKIREKNLSFCLEFSEGLPKYLLIDKTRIRQMLFNLIGNAIKFTQEGKIYVVAKVVNSENSNNLIDLIINIADTGDGIPENQQSRIFNAFEQQVGQSSTHHDGTGLGLAISRRLAEMMHGTITVESVVGTGSVFTISIPDIEIATIIEATDFQDNGNIEYDFSSGTILIVDDTADSRKLVKGFLAATNFSILEAANGKEALDQLRTHPIDLVFMDLRMPIMGGYETIKIIRNNPDWKKLPVIALSASLIGEQLKKVEQFDFNSYIRKPVNRKTLLAKIAEQLPCTMIKPTQVTTEIKEQQQKLPELVEQLDALLTEWEEIKDKGDFLLIENFCARLKVLAEDYQNSNLDAYATHLWNGVNAFDIEAVTALMDEYPETIDILRYARGIPRG